METAETATFYYGDYEREDLIAAKMKAFDAKFNM